ncbi:hypothetical protein P691DRAFT_797966 [Macrolepiota fuliginosa MF-IS2]|uniref:Fe2OG dioxygenase domain-containing protein n=1 Tax=Macrolepiota fuliginosa MF-IS2 TaxID=1400762 RepID=A0A9P6BYV8_9AGAR|nr:hypothetical protein P691DRAFT_797966 [Macrolepiota fuliginosa MF-IS2]
MTANTIEYLRSVLTDKQNLHMPWTSGVVNLSEPEKTLYFTRKDETSSSLRLGSTTEVQAADLSDACGPAGFGLGQENVLDDSYRKAGKLDEGKFSWNFNPDHGSFASEVATGLFPWNTLNQGIRFEMYKLNVYGEGSFFKPHQDTPRGKDMFGSLVLVLPFEHAGGNLLLRHRGQEFNFDGASLLKSSPPGSVAYVAFFSDVEHEVAKVTSGHRVTITYNLYFDPDKGPPVTKSVPGAQPHHPLWVALKDCLADEKFKKDHPYIGFGLSHGYPFKSAIERPKKLHLKGNDATLIQTLSELNVSFDFYLLYHEEDEGRYPVKCPFRILSRAIEVVNTRKDYSYSEWFENWDMDKDRYRSITVDWVTEPKKALMDRSAVLKYGNEASIGYYYHQLCVLAKVGPKEPHDSDKEKRPREYGF